MPDPEPPDYDAAMQEKWRENALQVPELLACSDVNLERKVATYARQFGYTMDAVREKIADDEMFAAFFATKPDRQGIHERIAAEWLESLESIRDFAVLPKSGASALYVTDDGEVKPRSDLQEEPTTKSLDFRWQTGETVCYAMHKHTRENGGHQGNQFREMISLLEEFRSCTDEKCILLVIVDGLYYTPARMARLRRSTRDHPPRSYAVHIRDVPAVLAHYAP